MKTTENTLQSQSGAVSPRISESFIFDLFSKPESEWTEDEVSMYQQYNSVREAEAKAIKEAKVKKAAEMVESQRKANELYRQKMRDYEKSLVNDGSIGWFAKRLVSEHGYSTPPIRITEYQDKVPEYVTHAYSTEVMKRGYRLDLDKNTSEVISYIARWLTTHTKPGLMLRGYVGIGKTTMLYAIRDVMNILLNSRLVIVDAREVASAGRNNISRVYDLADERLLGIDDLGTEPTVVKSYGNELSPVGELLTHRYNKRMFTIITTNLTHKERNNVVVDELQEVYGDRLFDRFKEMFNMLHYDPGQKSYRK